MSARKQMAWAAAIFAFLEGTAALAIVLLATGKFVAPGILAVPTQIVFVSMFPPFFLAASLFDEYRKTLRPDAPWWRQWRGLNYAESWEMLRWCPRYFLYPALLVVIASLIVGVSTGDVHYSSGQEFTLVHAIGFGNGTMVFAFITFPILVSVSRMPGTFRDQFAVKRKVN
jgi:hypothetical protein